ncbi:GGDEF domain-containing protein [Acinetobacter pragensis]|uniref:diguanylate cyclase n=1 Tax=Acinetobacter pragensis TaxID=1806892 RepID=A0A151Y6T8_9GAMM|nr:GGDEF domain-containing protein [Acinetobacter pragensis]KYQ73709.1 histidine kinase [Acinetobacter pragensis]
MRYLHNAIRIFQGLLLLSCIILLGQTSVFAQYESAPASFYEKYSDSINTLSFTENDSTQLQGQWLFYQKHFLKQPSSILTGKTVFLPASFKELTGSNENYGTFVGYFKIPKEFVGRRIGIKIPNQYGAYRVYLNGDFLIRLGEVGKNAESQVTENAPKIAYFIAEKEYFTLAIQASSFSSLHGGLENPMRIGIAKTINRQFQQLMMSIAVVCGGVLGIGFFTILFSLFRGSKQRNSKSIFVFGIFIIFLALHNFFSAPYAYTTVTEIDWLWGTRLEYLFTYLTILFFISYIHFLNARYLHRLNYQIAMLLLALNIGVTLIARPEIFERLALYCSVFSLSVLANFIYGFYQTLKLKEPYSLLNLCAVIFLCVTFLNDFLLLLNWVDSVNLSFISSSLYALLIMFQQSRNYAYQTFHTEQLNNNLMELNRLLDQKVKSRTEQLHELNAKLEHQVKVDALTGAYNRRALNDEIQERFSETKHQQHGTLIFAMLDVDYFKNYNDYYGHLKGDEILKQLVQIIAKSLPPSAFLARYGGEEFAIVLQNVPLQVSVDLMDAVMDAIRQAQLEHCKRGDQKNIVTVSMGMACMDRNQTYADIHALMRTADEKLYEAKQSGRDQLKAA